MKPEGKNWLFAILILGDIIQTFALELIAILCPSECVVSPLACAVSPTSANGTCVAAPANGTCTCVVTATVTIFSVIGIVSAIIPGILYVCKRIYDECQSNNDIKDKCQHYIDVTISCLYALLGPPLYYYGDNVSKVVDLVGDTFGCSADCQRALRISGVAVLFLFLLMNILIGRISKSKESKLNSKWWGPVADMIVELLPLHILYSAFLSIARSNMIFTSTSFCSVGDQAFFAVVCTITFIYAIFSIFYISFMKFIEEKPPTGYKVIVGVSGYVVFWGFVVYLLLDNSLPLDFRLCYASVDDIAAVMKCLHIVRAVLSAFCAIAVVCLGAVPELWYCHQNKYPMTQARLEAELRATLVKQLKKKLKKKLKNLSSDQSMDQVIAAAKFVVVNSFPLLKNQLVQLTNKLETKKEVIHSVVKPLADKVISQSEAQSKKQFMKKFKTQFTAVDEVLSPLLKSINQGQLLAQIVAQLVDQFVAVNSAVNSVVNSVAQSVAQSEVSQLDKKHLMPKQLSEARLVALLVSQSEVHSIAVQSVVNMVALSKHHVVNKSVSLMDQSTVKGCCCWQK